MNRIVERKAAASTTATATASDVILEWTFRQDISLLARSQSIEHLRANYHAATAAFDERTQQLTDADMYLVSSIANLVASPFLKAL